jgi:hypothetical protein
MQEVIVENRKTGHRKQMTVTQAKMLDLKYRIIPDAITTEKSPTFTPPIEKKTELEELQEKYFEKFKAKPHHRLGVAKLKELIEQVS